MAESAVHMGYVTMLGEFVQNRLSDCEHIHILMDKPDSTETPPHVVNGYRPDLYYRHNDTVIIGEAKTDEDFDRPHSIEQYKSYLQECANCPGEATLILAGSWRISPAYANLLRLLKRQLSSSVTVMVINEMGLFREIR